MDNDYIPNVDVESVVESTSCEFCHEQFKPGDNIVQIITGTYGPIEEEKQEFGISGKLASTTELHLKCFEEVYKLNRMQ